MGNSSDKEKQSRISNARFKSKVKEFLDNYGSIKGQEAKQWIDRTIAENFNSVTYTKFAQPTYRKSKQELLQAFERAYKGKWRPSLISFVDVNNKNGKQIIQVKYQNNVPYVKNPGQRINLFFQCTAIFDEQTRLWTNSTHKQYGYELEPYTEKRTYSQPSTYSAPTTYSQPISSTTNSNSLNEQKRRQEQTKRQREAADRDRISREQTQRARREVEQRNARYQQSQRKHRENMKRQQDAQREYRRQQEMQAEQRRRQYQQALSNRKY